MKDTSIFYVIRKAAILYLTYVVYMLLGIVALLIIEASLVTTQKISYSVSDVSSAQVSDMFSEWCRVGARMIPFGDLLEEWLGSNTGGLSALVDYFADPDRPAFSVTESWGYYCVYLLRNLAVLSLAKLILFCFRKVKELFAGLDSWLFNIMLIFATVLWVCASYAGAQWLVYVLEQSVRPDKTSVLYLIILLVSCAIHAVSLAFCAHKSVFLKIIIVFLEMGFEAVRALFAWLWLGTVPGLYSLTSREDFWECIYMTCVVAVVFHFLEKLEGSITGQWEHTDLKAWLPWR